MADTSKIAANLRAFQIAINAHDRENPTHDAYGIGLAHFDMERLGFYVCIEDLEDELIRGLGAARVEALIDPLPDVARR